MTRALVVLSCHAPDMRPILAAARARWPDAELTVVLRAPLRDACADLLAGATVLDDKPAQGRVAFLRALRRYAFDRGVVAWTGASSFWPSKVTFLLARVRAREVASERGTFTWSVKSIATHLLWRAKVPVHATAGMPPGIPWPFALVLATLRATVGRLLGPVATLLRTAARRLFGGSSVSA